MTNIEGLKVETSSKLHALHARMTFRVPCLKITDIVNFVNIRSGPYGASKNYIL